ncbi:hypothetical protein COEX109129_40760 [Corallococcus exiguus]
MRPASSTFSAKARPALPSATRRGTSRARSRMRSERARASPGGKKTAASFGISSRVTGRSAAMTGRPAARYSETLASGPPWSRLRSESSSGSTPTSASASTLTRSSCTTGGWKSTFSLIPRSLTRSSRCGFQSGWCAPTSVRRTSTCWAASAVARRRVGRPCQPTWLPRYIIRRGEPSGAPSTSGSYGFRSTGARIVRSWSSAAPSPWMNARVVCDPVTTRSAFIRQNSSWRRIFDRKRRSPSVCGWV